MKTRDYVLWGSSAASIAANAEGAITWALPNETYYEVDANEAIELVELGVSAPSNLYQTFVRNKDNTDWMTYAFYSMSDARMNEVPYANRRDWTKVRAAVAPNVTVKRAPSLKMSTGDRFKVYVKATSSAVSSAARVVAILRKYIAQNKAEQDTVEHYGYQFGGIESNAQVFHINGTISSTTANSWGNIFSQTILKNELFAYNKLGGRPVTNLAKYRIYIDEAIEYNQYPITTSYNMIPMVPEVITYSYDPTSTASSVTDYAVADHEYIFDKPLVVTKTTNKTVELQAQDDGTAVSSAIYGRLAGMKYKV